MALDLSKLKNVKRRTDGSVTAQCPACAGAGGDSKGEHLIVFSDGRYGCVASSADDKHRKEIHKLAGTWGKSQLPRPIEITRIVIPPPTVIMQLRRLGRVKGHSHLTEAVDKQQQETQEHQPERQ